MGEEAIGWFLLGSFSHAAWATENNSLAMAAAAAVIAAIVSFSYCCRQPQRRVHEGGDMVNPYALGGFATMLIPLVRLLHRVQGRPKVEFAGKRGTRAPVGWVFELLNAADQLAYRLTSHRIVPVREAQLVALADSLEKVDENDNTAHGMRLFLAELNREPVSATGRIVIQQWLTGLLHVRHHVQAYVRSHPEIHAIKIEAPVFIIGAPRTASSFLLRLLAHDSKFRTPKFWEINFPTPPPEEATYETDSRVALAQAGLESFNTIQEGFLENIKRFHFLSADAVEEDSLLLTYSMCFGMYFHMTPDATSPFMEWMFDGVDKDAAYKLHKQFIQLLSMKFKPKSCWLLKAPLHSFYPEVLLRTYPDARIVVTHRDYLKAIPSWTKFVLAHTAPMAGSKQWDPLVTAEQTVTLMETMVNRISKARFKADGALKLGQKSQFFDIYYDSLCERPVDTVEALYEHFNMEFSEEARASMQNWVDNNPQNRGMYGKTKHDVAWMGFTEAELRARMKRATDPEFQFKEEWRNDGADRRSSASTCSAASSQEASEDD